MILPYWVDVPLLRWPIANFAILGILAIVFLLELYAPVESLEPFILDGWAPTGMLGHMWLHVGFIHVLGNGLFLWVFGNGVCAKLGGLRYSLVYVGLGLLAAAFWNLTGTGPVVGASGAINGIVGLYLVFYPLNSVSCFYWFLYRLGTFSIAGYWMILLWLVFDLWGVVSGEEGVAYLAHVGGFLSGFTLGCIMESRGWVESASDEKSLVSILRGKRPGITREAGVMRSVGAGSPQAVEAGEGPPRAPGNWALPDVTPAAPRVISSVCSCGKRVRVPPGSAGRRYRCPFCGETRTIPSD